MTDVWTTDGDEHVLQSRGLARGQLQTRCVCQLLVLICTQHRKERKKKAFPDELWGVHLYSEDKNDVTKATVCSVALCRKKSRYNYHNADVKSETDDECNFQRFRRA